MPAPPVEATRHVVDDRLATPRLAGVPDRRRAGRDGFSIALDQPARVRAVAGRRHLDDPRVAPADVAEWIQVEIRSPLLVGEVLLRVLRAREVRSNGGEE